MSTQKPDPKLDLVFERIVDVPRERVWAAWTQPEHIKKWFTPAPWKTVECEIDLRPGGIFRTMMQSPEGEKYPNLGCYLEVVEQEKIVWTVALGPGYRPKEGVKDVPTFTAILTFEKHPKGTKYTALVMHKDEEGCKTHEKMGFHDGWGAAFEQLLVLVKGMKD